jgi:Family of unknown function (DUF5709)
VENDRSKIDSGETMTDADYERDDEWDAVEDDGVLDSSDTLENDPAGEPLDVGYEPADRYAGANRFGTTVAEQRQGESLDQLLAQEEPDVDAYAQDDDEDEDELTRRGPEEDPRSGRLVAEDEGLGPDEDDQSFAEDAGIDYGASSAEEAAVHLADDPNGPGTGPEL